MRQLTSSKPLSIAETTGSSVEDQINHGLDLFAMIRRKYQPQQDEYLTDVLKNIREQMEGIWDDTYRNTKTMHDMLKILNQIKRDQCIMMQKIGDAATEEISDETYNMTPDEIRNLMVEKVELDKSFYPSDIAIEYGLDYDKVLKAIDILRKEGRIVDRS